MASPTNLSLTTLISNNITLPFRLAIQPIAYYHFGTEDVKLDYINKLVHHEDLLKDVVYPIKEYDNFSIILESEQDCEVTVKLSIIKTELNGDDFMTFTLNKQKQTHEVFRYIKNRSDPEKNIFPWSADDYHFEVIYENVTYYGLLHVEPRHMSEDDLEWMRELINEKLYGLVIDFMKYKRSRSALDSIQETPFWYLWEWYKKNERNLLTQIHLIEQQSARAIEKIYKVQGSPKKFDHHSLRWATTAKGVMHHQTKFLNRRIHYIDDSEENRNAKQFIRKIYLKLMEIQSMIYAVKADLEKRKSDLEYEIKASEKRLNSAKNQSAVSQKEINKFRNIHKFKTKELKKLMQQLGNYDVMCKEIDHNVIRLSATMNTLFWQSISTKPSRRILLGNYSAYKVIYKVYKEMSLMLNNETEKAVQLPVYKKTDELYEYFAFFSIMDLFIKQGFEANHEALSDQLKASFYQEGIRDGTHVRLEREDWVVFLVYDEEIAFTEVQAKERYSRLMTEQEKRKPDLRLDAYKMVDEQLLYNSSIIIELKCRPLKNIYNSAARTDEMIQMSNYKHILRINSDEELKKSGEKYNHHAIRFVLCLYAGASHYKKPYIEASCGKFIRFAPQVEDNPTNMDFVEQEIFQRWLKL